MKLRKIRTGLLLKSAFCYRIFIIIMQSIFWWIWTRKLKLAVSMSIIWNICNMGLYFSYHYIFARMFRLGKKNKREILA